MKTILTRGGIEFLAVLLGISGSLWIDNYSKEKEIYTALNQDLSNIKLDIQQDLEEINKIESLQQELNQVTFQLGQLEISKIRLKKSEEQLLDILNEVEKKEKDLASELNKKYGRGTLDTKTGNFTPIG